MRGVWGVGSEEVGRGEIESAEILCKSGLFLSGLLHLLLSSMDDQYNHIFMSLHPYRNHRQSLCPNTP